MLNSQDLLLRVALSSLCGWLCPSLARVSSLSPLQPFFHCAPCPLLLCPDIIRYLVSTAAQHGQHIFSPTDSSQGFTMPHAFFVRRPNREMQSPLSPLAAYLQPRHAFSMHVPVPFTTPLPLVSIGYRDWRG